MSPYSLWKTRAFLCKSNWFIKRLVRHSRREFAPTISEKTLMILHNFHIEGILVDNFKLYAHLSKIILHLCMVHFFVIFPCTIKRAFFYMWKILLSSYNKGRKEMNECIRKFLKPVYRSSKKFNPRSRLPLSKARNGLQKPS